MSTLHSSMASKNSLTSGHNPLAGVGPGHVLVQFLVNVTLINGPVHGFYSGPHEMTAIFATVSQADLQS